MDNRQILVIGYYFMIQPLDQCSAVIRLNDSDNAKLLETALTKLGIEVFFEKTFEKLSLLITDQPDDLNQGFDTIIGLGLPENSAHVNLSKTIGLQDLACVVQLQAQLLVEQARLEKMEERKERWKKSALRDTLTKIPNRRAWKRDGMKLIANAIEKKLVVSMAMIDVKQLKLVNDKQSYEAGDLLLKYLGKTLSVCLEGKAIVARLGGDEFAAMSDSLSRLQLTKELSKVETKFKKTIAAELPDCGKLNYGVLQYQCVADNQVDDLFAVLEKEVDEHLRAVKRERPAVVRK